MAMDEKGLGKRLQVARQKAGLTQQLLCQRANLSYSTLAKIERGAIKSPSIFTVRSIAEALNLSLDDLLGYKPGQQALKLRHKTKSGVSFIYFDVNGCLVRFFQRAFSRIAEDFAVPADIVETTFWHYNDEVCSGTLSSNDFNEILAKRIGQPTIDWSDYYLMAAEPLLEMHELIKWVSEYYAVGLLSNTMPGLLGAMLASGQLPALPYAAIIDSSEVGAVKPDPRIFEIAAEQAQTPVSELLLIDDTRANLVAAEKLGWHVLWFDYGRPEESVLKLREALEIAP